MHNDQKPKRLLNPPSGEVQSVASAAVKLGAELTGVPGLGAFVGATVDLANERTERLRAAMLRDQEARLRRFYAEMIKGDQTMEQKVAQVMIDDRDFHALVRACMADIEGEKTGAYAALARALATGKVAREWRRHFILSLRDLSGDDLARLKEAYVAKHHELIPTQGSNMGEKDFLKPGPAGSREAISIANLVARGFVHQEHLSPTGEAFTSACWPREALTPSSIGLREWSGHKIAIVSYEIGERAVDDLCIELQEKLHHADTKSTIFAADPETARRARLMATMGVLVLSRRSKHLEEKLPAAIEFATKVPTLLVDLSEHGLDLEALPAWTTIKGFGRANGEVSNEVLAALAERSRGLSRRA